MKSLKPEEWRKKHEEDKKRKKPKRPDMRTYEPKEVKAYSKKPLKQGEWNRVERFKTEKGGSGLGPGKYLNFNDWSGKSKIASRIPYKSTYYH